VLALPRKDRWQAMARAALRDELHSVHVQLTGQVLAHTSPEDSAADRVAHWQEGEGTAVRRATTTLDEICADDRADLARLSVGLRVVRTLLTTP
jgi:glutamate dehydrogenase